MGISKAMMEKVAISESRSLTETTICLTRYGNVMASRGSVIPLFINQIKKGEPLTITDPHMTRFLMSLHDAVDLVLFAFEHGQPGDLFVNKAPAATIGVLANAIKELANANNELRIIGTRHGEKLYETLCTREEMVKAVDMGDFFRIPADNRDLNYSLFMTEGDNRTSQVNDYNSHNAQRLDKEEVKRLISTLAVVKRELFGEAVVEYLV
jgi:UDP-glucose 4-epimerase